MNRGGFANMLNEMGLKNQAAEIGTHKGVFAAEFLSKWRGECLWCIDPWTDNLPGYDDLIKWPREPDFLMAVNLLTPHAARCQIVRMTGSEAIVVVPNELDFVYIDANHSYEATSRDIAEWWPKVRSGGILAGHDYEWEGRDSVERAVKRHAGKTNTKIELTNEASNTSWWIRKP